MLPQRDMIISCVFSRYDARRLHTPELGARQAIQNPLSHNPVASGHSPLCPSSMSSANPNSSVKAQRSGVPAQPSSSHGYSAFFLRMAGRVFTLFLCILMEEIMGSFLVLRISDISP